ncbi:hypothetical protein NECAME_06155 [Necator americanus]|uniref:Uncharacterized protein n=1 Tax=Necator americanus TaxID=51031 RepID=W2TUY4_NECAM|nr:hypothetical protein NECAME_06155 [Necator americanus]ETN85910.1 hypothetical protein NECAME_06155 [Necator americanus]
MSTEINDYYAFQLFLYMISFRKDTMLPAAVDGEYPPPPLVGRPFAQTAIPYSILFVAGVVGVCESAE